MTGQKQKDYQKNHFSNGSNLVLKNGNIFFSAILINKKAKSTF